MLVNVCALSGVQISPPPHGFPFGFRWLRNSTLVYPGLLVVWNRAFPRRTRCPKLEKIATNSLDSDCEKGQNASQNRAPPDISRLVGFVSFVGVGREVVCLPYR